MFMLFSSTLLSIDMTALYLSHILQATNVLSLIVVMRLRTESHIGWNMAMGIYLEIALHDDYKSACAINHSYTANL